MIFKIHCGSLVLTKIMLDIAYEYLLIYNICLYIFLEDVESVHQAREWIVFSFMEYFYLI